MRITSEKIIYHICLKIIMIAVLANVGYGQTLPLRNYSADDGMSSSYVACIYQIPKDFCGLAPVTASAGLMESILKIIKGKMGCPTTMYGP